MPRSALALLLVPALLLLSPTTTIEARPGPDGPAGTVVAVQGAAYHRAPGRDRWSPLRAGDTLEPGDRVRTLLRGAHAAEILLPDGSVATLGPGGVLGIGEGGELTLHQGELVNEAAGSFLRAGPDAVESLDGPPDWYRRYRETSTEEWMGSLVAQVDGRNVPLTIGTHQVRVTIRDQVAETVVEETFENRTDGVLEGEFTFPLPADASVSGFGMWIGDELVMADIVERQRARQIYEDIRRRRKDPGLLEWSGGNLFKARVFPIPARGAKRIKLRYTQVLPLRGNSYRYRYALRSELTKKHPLEKLSIQVEVDSADFLGRVECLSHPYEGAGNEHYATLRYDAVEARPDRDFEVEVNLADPEPLTLVPHRRGEDGYFLLLVTPPGPEASGWQRELTGEGEPIDVILLADTSGSMGRDERRAQSEFVEALLAQLGAKDTFRLAACDVGVVWFDEKPRPVAEEDVRAALAFLDERVSLGWSDLGPAVEAALAAAGERTQVLYLGDGIETAGDADPAALAARIRSLGETAKGTCHAVAVGTAYEKGVMEAIASVGGGSVREAGGDPAEAARELVSGISRPVIRNATLSIEGLRTAKVYPEVLPNLPAGMQQIVVGRYLPGEKDGRGKVTLRGTLSGEPVAYTGWFPIRAANAEDSFLPRLWARRHIDALLAEPPSPARNDEIVLRSREFGIMTPLTSLLVLESDEDRERYGVERTVQMRDGEAFFSAAREKVRTDLLREAAAKGRSFRESLERSMLSQIRDLGRSLPHSEFGGYGFGYSGTTFGVASEGGGWQSEITDGARITFNESVDSFEDGFEVSNHRTPLDPEEPPMGDAQPLFGRAEAMDEKRLSLDDDRGATISLGKFMAPNLILRSSGELTPSGGARFGFCDEELEGDDWAVWALGGMFPALEEEGEDAAPARRLEGWPEEVRELISTLERRDFLRDLRTGIEAESEEVYLHPLRGTPVSPPIRARGLLAPESWYEKTQLDGGEPGERWRHAGARGVLNSALRLGRRETLKDGDPVRDRIFSGLTRWSFPWSPESWRASVEPVSDTELRLVFTAKGEHDEQNVFTIDLERSVVTAQETRRNGERAASVSFEDFVMAGGCWWPTRLRRFDSEGRLTSRKEVRITESEPAAVLAEIREALAGHSDAIFLRAKEADLRVAKQLAFEGKAGIPEQWRIVLHHAVSGRWDRAWRAFLRVEELAGGKPGLDWLRVRLQAMSRRGEELKASVRDLASRAGSAAMSDRPYLADTLADLAAGSLGPEERLSLVAPLLLSLEPGQGDLRFTELLADWYREAHRGPEGLRLWERLRARRPADPAAVQGHLRFLKNLDETDAAAKTGTAALRHEAAWTDYEADEVYELLTELLWEERRISEFFGVVNRWLERAPASVKPYQRYLAGLREARPAEADHWISARLEEGPGEEGDAVQRTRLRVAVEDALGNSWRRSTWSLDPRYERPLAELARSLVARGGRELALAGQLLGNGSFSRSDAGRDLEDDLLAKLEPSEIEALPEATLCFLVDRVDWSSGRVDDPLWRSVREHLEKRLDLAEAPGSRRRLERSTVQLLTERGDRPAACAVLTLALARADRDRVPELAEQLRGLILELPAPLAAGFARQAVRLLPQCVRPQEDENPWRHAIHAQATRETVQKLFDLEVQTALGPQAERDELSRAELRQKKLTARAKARESLAELLAEEAPDMPPALRRWLDLERLCFLVELGRPVETGARKLLAESDIEADSFASRLLIERLSLVLSYAALRADEAGAERAIEFFRQLEPKGADPEETRLRTLRLLIARGDREAVEVELESWIVPGRVDSTWRVILGHLLAEEGRLAEAAKLFETAAERDELSADDYGVLALWHLALGDEARAEAVREERWRVESVRGLRRRIDRAEQRFWDVEEEEGPLTLDEETVAAARAYLARAVGSNVDYQLGHIEGLYRPTKDFRILEPLADAVLGRSPQAIYAILDGIRDELIEQVFEEATLDAIVGRIDEVRPEARGPAARRALDLLTVLAEVRAAEVLRNSDPHEEAAREALVRASKEECLPGEPRLLAWFLTHLTRLGERAPREEQVRQLRALLEAGDPATVEGLSIAHALGETLRAHGEREAAVESLTRAVRDFRRADPGSTREELWGAIDALVSWLEEGGEFERAEDLLQDEQSGPDDPRWRDRCLARTLHLYVAARKANGKVSLGEGEALYRAARDLLLGAMDELGAAHAYGLVSDLIDLHEAQAVRMGKSVVYPWEDLVAFSRGKFPEILPRAEPYNRGSWVTLLGNALQRMGGDRAALEFYVERMEAEPDWLVRSREDLWPTLCSPMANLFKPGKFSDLEPRLLAVVLRELGSDLRSRESRSRNFYAKGQHGFWDSKAGEFARVAREVVAESRDAPSRLLHCARYLWDGLELGAEAVDILREALARGRLRPDGRLCLAKWLAEQEEWRESVEVLAALAGEFPEEPTYRLELVRSLHGGGRQEESLAAAKAVAERFRGREAWEEEDVSNLLAEACLECDHFELGAELFEESLTLLRKRPRDPYADDHGLQAEFYEGLARCLSGLGRHAEAVDAASAAVVAWGDDYDSRKDALETLRDVVGAIEDLDSWVSEWDAKVAETGLDSPLFRLTLGRVYLSWKGKSRALAQFLRARDLSPDDPETHEAVVNCYQRLGMPVEERRAQLALLSCDPDQLEICDQVAQSFLKSELEQEAERAWTTLAELDPEEADGHRLLAGIREEQDRLDEAVVQWRQVVRTRTFDPEGWISLAEALWKAGRTEEAKKTAEDILDRTWGEAQEDVHDRAREILDR